MCNHRCIWVDISISSHILQLLQAISCLPHAQAFQCFTQKNSQEGLIDLVMYTQTWFEKCLHICIHSPRQWTWSLLVQRGKMHWLVDGDIQPLQITSPDQSGLPYFFGVKHWKTLEGPGYRANFLSHKAIVLPGVKPLSILGGSNRIPPYYKCCSHSSVFGSLHIHFEVPIYSTGHPDRIQPRWQQCQTMIPTMYLLPLQRQDYAVHHSFFTLSWSSSSAHNVLLCSCPSLHHNHKITPSLTFPSDWRVDSM